MNIIFVDVTNCIVSCKVTGIQRALTEFLRVLEGTEGYRILRLREIPEREEITYAVESVTEGAPDRKAENGCDEKDGVEESENKVPGQQSSVPGEKPAEWRPLTDARPGDIWLDMDSVWHNEVKRSALYPLLQRRGVRIASYLYDLIPVHFPEYVDEMTGVRFRGYLSAVLRYADLILSETEAGISEIKALESEMGETRPERQYCATRLGCSFGAAAAAEETRAGDALSPAKETNAQGKGDVGEETTGKHAGRIKALQADPRPYVLQVGTVEPRKNHKLLLDAAPALYEAGWQIVFAGRRGWNVDALMERIRKEEAAGRGFTWIEAPSDEELNALYQGADCVAVPSFAEGFGLPVVEALYRGAPVIAGTHPVLREAGGDLCDYVDPDDPKAFAELLIRLGTVQESAPTGLEQRRERIAKWRAANTFDTWEDVGRRLLGALDGFKTLHRPDPKDFAPIEPAVIPPERLHQLLILTARAEDLLRSLPLTERHLPFLDELILGCPEKMVSEVQANYHGRLKVTFLTDEALLAGRPLPADHAARNMLLRYLAISDPHLEDAFLMGDDDSRPLQDMTAADFYAEGGVCYKGLILQDLALWHGTEGKRVSFDISMFKARDFLIAHGMPTFMHDAHCMQIIDKRYFLEMVRRFPETVEQAAVSEWNGPFNYMAWAYPEVIRFEPYATVNWPGFDEDWDPLWRADVPLFENHYDSAYEPESFYDHPGRLYGIDEEDEAAKADRDIFLRKSRAAVQNAYRSWEKAFAEANGCRPVFVLTEEGIKVPARMELHLPSWVEAPFLRLSIRHFGVRRTSETESVATSGKSKTSAAAASSGKASAKATYETASEYDTQLTFVISENALPVVSPGSSRFSASSLRPVHVLLQLPAKAGTFTVTWTCYTNDRKREAVTELILTYD